MPINKYLASYDLLRFQDEQLKENACNTVDLFLKNNTPIRNAPLHTIAFIIQTKDLPGLKDLIINQKNKDTKKDEDKAFWGLLNDLILAQPGPEYSLSQIIQNELKVHNLLMEESAMQDKIEQKKIKKANKAIVNEVLNQSLAIYFEHFNSHYFYMTRQGAVS